MKALIPVAGIGTRLRPHTWTVPKALLNVAGKPILGHLIDDLLAVGIDSFCFVTGYMGDEIRVWAEATYQVPMTWVEQDEMLGLGHAVLTAADTIAGEPIFIMLGDTLFEAELGTVLEQGGNSLGVMEVADPTRFGVVVMEGDMVVRLVEKPDTPISRLAIAGLYHITETDLLLSSLQRLVDEDIRTRGEYQLTDALSLMLEAGAVFHTFRLRGWHDCGVPATVLATNRALLGRLAPVPPPAGNAVIIPPVFLAEEVTLDASVVGPHVTIDRGATVRRSVVSNAIVGAEALIEGAVVEGSILGARARVSGRPLILNIGDSAEVGEEE